jgi:1-acyl-sn-glycerol-3-phosphate acyltransferase
MTDRSASHSTDRPLAVPARANSPTRAVRSLTFILLYCLYVLLVIGGGQRLVIWPLITIFPKRRRAIVRWWLRFNARATFALARGIGGLRLTIEGRIPPEPVVVIMNHQSVLDIPLGVLLTPGPYPIIPTRDRYGKRIPGIAPLTRIAEYPLVSQGRTAKREELLALKAAADKVHAGDNSLVIFPEGHRTRYGEIAPFMKSGLSLILPRARRPVYCIVADGMWHARTIWDAMLRFAGLRVHARVIGPFDPPTREEADGFLDGLRERMIAEIEDMRRASGEAPSLTNQRIA